MLAQIYDENHQAARLAFAGFLDETADVDAADRSAWRRVEASWLRLRGRLDAHGFHEDVHIRPMIHVADPRLARRLDAQHQTLERLGRDIDEELAALHGIDGVGERRRAAADLFRSVSGFLSEYCRHMSDEDSLAMPALADSFHPTALFAARRTLLATIAYEEQCTNAPIAAAACPSPERSSLAQAACLTTQAFLEAATSNLAARLARTAPAPIRTLRRAA